MRVIFEQQQFPIFQNRVYETRQDAIDCLKGDIKLVEDEKTGLVYNAAINPDMLVYDANYNNEQGLSPSFNRHLLQVADLIDKVLGRHELVEVGCGKGRFLEMLLDRCVDITGFDPAYVGNNPRVIKKNFDPSIITTPAKAFILRHVLEHIPSPYEFLCQLRDANGGCGLIYIEVPCFDWILRNRAWFDIFYEHVSYFRLRDFDRMFGRIVHKGCFFGGQYIYVVADLASLQEPYYDESHGIEFPSDFLESLSSEKDNTKPVCIWGGSSKGVIFSLLRSRAGLPIKAVIDINPEKQGGFLPATGLVVLSPKQALAKLPSDAEIYVMNSNYIDEIREATFNRFNLVSVDR